MPERYHLAYKLRGALMAPPYLFVLAVFAGETEHAAFTWGAGLALFTLGLSLRVWAQMHLHYRLSVRKQLTTTGPYTWVRNPIYIANTAMLLGVTAMSELLWFLPIMFAWCMVVYYFVIRREEAHLSGKYGDPYTTFLSSVPRWWPSFTRSASPGVATRSFFFPSIRAEVGCLLLLLPVIGKEIVSTLYFQ